MNKRNKYITAYNKIISVINSSKTLNHFIACERLVNTFFNHNFTENDINRRTRDLRILLTNKRTSLYN